MDYVVESALKQLGKSPVDLSKSNIKGIKEQFPIPNEHKILWADVTFGRRISGLVVTDIGLFIKGSSSLIKEENENAHEKKDKINSIYHYIKWEFFDSNDFEMETQHNICLVKFNKKKVLEIGKSNNFFKAYSETYKSIVKEAVVSAENIFADLEAVVPENFAAVNTKTGHGEMAEEALNLLDKLSGKDAKVVGRTNEKDGADRLVDGVEIQTKYYATGKGCVDACFDKTTGSFRYESANGEPMLIEVPKDKYAEAINEFRKKILEGKVPGVTNPDDASKYVKQGKLTYKQALNLCKPGTIESLTYDSLTGAINCSFAFGITFLTTFIISYSQTGDRKEAMNSAFAAGIQVFGLAFFAHVFTQQVARTTLTKQLIPLSAYIVNVMGYKTVQTIVNAIRSMAGKSAISGAAAMKQLAKILRSNVVTSVITFVVFSVPDTYNIFKKRLSSAQYTKNMLSLIGTMAAAGGGTLGASLIAAKIGAATGTTIAPGVGTAIGIVGGLAGGLIGGTVVKAAGDVIHEDDSVIISRLFNAVVINMVYEYMLSESEINVVMEKFDTIKPKEFKNLFKTIISSERQEKDIEDFIRHFYEEVIRNRPQIAEPTPTDLIGFIEQFKDAKE
ncbi:MAG: hypothetical protein RSD17_04660 [Oscillospiraceae bacterium]